MSDLAIGIMSGTSGDGVDAALVSVDDAGGADPIAHWHVPFPEDLRARVLAAASHERLGADEIARLHGALGDAYAEAALAVAKNAERPVSVIGLHGQTIAHLPDDHVTFQIGDGARVAVRTGVATVTDFRSADIAAGGQGAPLALFADSVLFGQGAPRVVVNLGGIANLALMPDADRDHMTGFDTGPGNMIIDLVAKETGQEYDAEGAGARRGRVIGSALSGALRHPFFALRPPKSCGREEFGAAFAQRLISDVRSSGGSHDDALATATELTARSVAEAIRPATPPGVDWRDVLIAGGGARNPFLLERLGAHLAPIPVRPTDDVGVPAEAREAIAFAILAVYRMRGLPNTLPQVTGATRAVSGGVIHRP